MDSEINGVRVVWRERFPSRVGWGLLGAVRRLDAKRAELRTAGDTGAFLGAIMEALTFDEIAAFVSGAVAEWDFPGDPATPEACEALNLVDELLPIAAKAVDLFYTANDNGKLRGEAASGSTSGSEA